MASRSRRSVSKPSYKEHDSFLEELLASPPVETPRRSRGRPPKCIQLDSGSDTNDAKFAIVSNEYPKIVLEDVRFVGKDAKEITTPRRSRRPRHKSAAYDDSQETVDKLEQLRVDDDSDNAGDLKSSQTEKPTSLFTDDDIDGTKIFGFKTTHRKTDLLKKALESALETPKKREPTSQPNSPRTPKSALKIPNPYTPKSNKRVSIQLDMSHLTPKSLVFSDSNVPKTPRTVRKRMQKNLQILIDEDNEGSDFSASDSDYCPSDEDSDDDKIESDDESASSSKSTSSSRSTSPIKTSRKMNKSISKACSSKNRVNKDTNFFMKSDKYFSMHSSKKAVTSNHTMERLKNPRLTEEKLQTILKDHVISSEHQSAIKELIEDHKNLFDKWFYFLSEGFSILLYGVGSKEKLIREFQKEKLSTYPCVVLNGFFPSLTLKDILEPIMVDLLELSSVPSNVYEAISQIEEEMSEMPNDHIFLLVHNLDGALLRNNKSQHVLSKLAKIRNIHLIASIDHINAPLYWDHAKLSDYNFSWWDTTTLLPYVDETSYEGSLLVHKSGVLALSSLNSVFNSLTTNAKGIFMIIVKNQLESGKAPHYQGITFKNLYWSARESFLVSSDLALRAQLTEFLDHKLVKSKRSVDGAENLIIPMESALLQQFYEQQDDQ